MLSWDEIEHQRQIKESKPFWRCEECGYEDHVKPLPKDRAKFYAKEKSAICKRCKSEALVPIGF